MASEHINPTVQDSRVEIFKSPQAILGTGAYGAVYRAKLNELPCAAKILQPILFETNDPGKYVILQRFDQECQLLRSIQHPNIVQYLDVTRDPDSGLPVLLMELLDESLTSFFERVPRPLPYHIQVNLSHDIALAIAHLHSKGIVHRDLSSNNVLLIAGCKAKVTDFGMSKLVRSTNSRHSLTQLPGTQAFMPPEAFLDEPQYSSMIDCFSFGPLVIQLVTTKFPNPSPRQTKVPDDRSPTGFIHIPILEEERRRNHISLINPSHPLLPIARQCLQYSAEKRPTAQQLCRQVAELKLQQFYSDSKELSVPGNDNHESILAEKQREIKSLEQQVEQEAQNREVVSKQLEKTEREVYKLEAQVKSLNTKLRVTTDELSDTKAKLSSKEDQLSKKEENNRYLKECYIKATHLIKEKDQNIENLTKQLKESQNHLEIKQDMTNKPQLQDSTPRIPLKWLPASKAPHKMYRGSRAVDGSIVYFKNGQNKDIFQYDTDLNQWQKIPTCPKFAFSIALIEGTLTAVGGTDVYGKETSSLMSFIYEESRKWKDDKYPPMPTKRSHTTSVVSGHLLIVMGGITDGKNQLQTIELLHIPDRQWHRACDLPQVMYEPSATICGDRMYLLGWKNSDNQPTTDVLSCSLLLLEKYSTPCRRFLSLAGSRQQPPVEHIWKKAANLLLSDSTCITVRGDQLVALGGEQTDSERKQYSPAVYYYDTANDCWIKISEMLTGRSSSLVAAVSTNKLIVVGGFTDVGTFTDRVEVASF